MYMRLLLAIFCFTAQLLYAYDQSNTFLFLDEEQQFLLKKDWLQEKTNRFCAKLEKIKKHLKITNLCHDINIARLFRIAEDHATILQKMTRAEFNAFFEALEEHFEDPSGNLDDSLLEFKHAVDFLQKTLLVNYSVNELFIFGILYEFFDDYIQINQEMFNVNTHQQQ